jgi:hypothetical protein
MIMGIAHSPQMGNSLGLTFIELTGSEPTSLFNVKERQGAGRTKRETTLQSQFDRAQREMLTFADLADKLKKRGIRMPDADCGQRQRSQVPIRALVGTDLRLTSLMKASV